ncbi:hypothetical protein Q3G72_033002 [Acer saccharum]|nr:hypothetical protein Q3G72_033002 [Acer saccharum]
MSQVFLYCFAKISMVDLDALPVASLMRGKVCCINVFCCVRALAITWALHHVDKDLLAGGWVNKKLNLEV